VRDFHIPSDASFLLSTRIVFGDSASPELEALKVDDAVIQICDGGLTKSRVLPCASSSFFFLVWTFFFKIEKLDNGRSVGVSIKIYEVK